MLDRHPLLNSADLEQTRDFHDAVNLGLEPLDMKVARGKVRSLANHYDHADFQLYAFQHDVDMTLTAGAENPHYWVAVPINHDQSSGHIRLSRRAGRLASPTREDPVYLRARAETLGLCIKQHALMDFTMPYLGEDNLGPVVFDHHLDITRPAFRALGQLVVMIVAQEAQDETLASDEIRLSAFRDSVIATLLHFCPNSYSGMLRSPAAAPGPRDVRRVIDYIRANPQQPITLADLVAVAQVPGRTLNAHFRAFTGLAPMAYLKRARLARARQLLQSGRAVNVTDAALRAGLTHLGRFATDYRRAFGERPSETFAKGRRH